MRYAKKLGLFTSAIVLGLVFMAVSASAQVRVGVQFGGGYYHRPRFVQRVFVPGPFWYDGYYGDPYWRERSDRYYDRQSLRTAKHRLNKDEDKYYDDGYITPKEQRKLDSDRYKLDRDRNRLRNDW
jgi:hypothetical protein